MRRTDCDDLDPTVLMLRRVLRSASRATLLATLAACGADASANERFDLAPYCAQDRWIPTSNLALPKAVPYVALMQRSDQAFSVLSASGVPCEGASDTRVCMAEIDRVAQGLVPQSGTFLLTTEGDVIRAFQTLEEKLALLGTLDTPDEVLIMARSAGYPVDCQARVGRRSDGFGVHMTQNSGGCGAPTSEIWLHVAENGDVDELDRLEDGSDCDVGRRPPGLVAARRRRTRSGALGRYFARVARMERASVDAFEILERELVLEGIPRALRDALRTSADDEVRHARDTARLAERFGARALPAELVKVARRSREEIALDNAIEGCVKETHAAYLAHVQLGFARDPELRRVLWSIAREETRHAALAWQLAAWLEPTLDHATQRRIARARLAAIDGLGRPLA